MIDVYQIYFKVVEFVLRDSDCVELKYTFPRSHDIKECRMCQDIAIELRIYISLSVIGNYFAGTDVDSIIFYSLLLCDYSK